MQRIDCGGKFTYVFTPYAQPIAEVEDGETFEVVTEDAFVGALNLFRDCTLFFPIPFF